MTKKAPNYTEAQTAEILRGYAEAVQTGGPVAGAAWVNAYAAEHGRKPASVRAKLVRLEAYQAPERQTKRSATKAEIVTAIAELCGATDDVMGSLTKASAKPLKVLFNTLSQMQEELNERAEDCHPLESD